MILEVDERLGSRNRDLFNQAHDIAINQMIENLPEGVLTYENYPFTLPQNECAEKYYNLLFEKSKIISVDSQGNVSINGKAIGKVCGRKPVEPSELQKEIIKSIINKSSYYSQEPSEVERITSEWYKPSKDLWKRILSREAASSVKANTKKTWKKFSRKLGEPFKGRTYKRVIKIVVGIDTSGSIGSEQFKQFINCLKNIQSVYSSQFYVIECDTKIQKEYILKKFCKIDNKVKGGGGTNFIPLFNRCKELKPDLLIFFTDTQGTFPNYKPKHKTIFVNTDEGNVPFGKLLIIKDEKN